MISDWLLTSLFLGAVWTAAWIDARSTCIPDPIPLTVLILSLISWAADIGSSIQSRLTAGIFCGGFLWLLRTATKGGVGLGDVKFMAAAGFFIGGFYGISALFLGYTLAALWYIIPLLRGKVSGKTRVPMAPFFAAALTMVCLLRNTDIPHYLLWGW